MTLLNAFSVDVEDYFQVSAFEDQIDRSDWDSYPLRVENNTRRIVEILEEHQVRATFFVLGWVAEKMPRLIQEIHELGHEIASHSHWHRLIYRMTPERFREDLVRSQDVLQSLIGDKITSFRAPSFSITEKSKWALEILAEEGFTTDSSIFPIYHDRYGIPNAPTGIHQIQTKSGPLWEFPPSVVRIARINVPVSGGGYFRLYPNHWSLHWLESINSRESKPFVFYIHPWEIDPGQPRLNAGSRVSRLRHYVNLSSTENKLHQLLQRFQFGTVSETIAATRRVSENEGREPQKLVIC